MIALGLVIAFILGQSFSQSPSPDVYLDDLPSTATYTIKTDGTDYWAVRDDGAMLWETTNATTLIDSSITSGDRVFRGGTYKLDGKITIDVDNIAFVGEEGENVVFEMGANAYFSIESTSTLRDNIRFKNIFFDGNGTATKAITSENMPSGNRTQRLTIEHCTFKNWDATDALPIIIKNPELVTIRNNYIATWGDISWTDGKLIKFYTDEYNAGNIWVYDNELNLRSQNGTCILIECSDASSTMVNVELRGNHYYGGGSWNGKYAVTANASGNYIVGLKILDGRTEDMALYDAWGNNPIYTEIIGGTWQVSGNSTRPFIRFRWEASHYGTRNSYVQDAYFRVTGTSVCIDDDCTSDTLPNIIKDNVFYVTNSPTLISPSTRTIIEGNIGYNPYGNSTSCVSSSDLIDSNSGSTIANNTEYTCRNSPKNVFISGGTVLNVYVNADVVFTSTNVTICLESGDTFEVEWSSTPTIKVMAH